MLSASASRLLILDEAGRHIVISVVDFSMCGLRSTHAGGPQHKTIASVKNNQGQYGRMFRLFCVLPPSHRIRSTWQSPCKLEESNQAIESGTHCATVSQKQGHLILFERGNSWPFWFIE